MKNISQQVDDFSELVVSDEEANINTPICAYQLKNVLVTNKGNVTRRDQLQIQSEYEKIKGGSFRRPITPTKEKTPGGRFGAINKSEQF